MRRSWALLGLALVMVSGCGDGAGSCLRDGEAKVCAARNAGALSFEASGLKPGSTLEIGTVGTDPLRAQIGPDGEPEANLGAVGVAFPARVEIVAVTLRGDPLRGTLVVG